MNLIKHSFFSLLLIIALSFGLAQTAEAKIELCVNVKSDCAIPIRTELNDNASCSNRRDEGFYSSAAACCRDSVNVSLSRWYNQENGYADCVALSSENLRKEQAKLTGTGTSGTGTSGTGQPAGADGSGIVNPVVSGRTGSDAAAAESGSLFMMIISGILTFLMLLGAFLVLINLVQAAIDWISSGGDSSKVIKSRDRIIQSVIGILILSASYAIWRLVVGEFLGVNFVFSRLFP